MLTMIFNILGDTLVCRTNWRKKVQLVYKPKLNCSKYESTNRKRRWDFPKPVKFEKTWRKSQRNEQQSTQSSPCCHRLQRKCCLPRIQGKILTKLSEDFVLGHSNWSSRKVNLVLHIPNGMVGWCQFGICDIKKFIRWPWIGMPIPRQFSFLGESGIVKVYQ